MIIRALPLLTALTAAPALAQGSGWTYSPYAGEGDRAAMGCSFDSNPDVHACIVVRCEDDYSVGVHIDTTRRGGDAGAWTISVDDQSFAFDALAIAGSPMAQDSWARPAR